MITKRGIYYDLNDSTYTLKVEGLTFYFSSEFYRMKFAEINNIISQAETLFNDGNYRASYEMSQTALQKLLARNQK